MLKRVTAFLIGIGIIVTAFWLMVVMSPGNVFPRGGSAAAFLYLLGCFSGGAFIGWSVRDLGWLYAILTQILIDGLLVCYKLRMSVSQYDVVLHIVFRQYYIIAAGIGGYVGERISKKYHM